MGAQSGRASAVAFAVETAFRAVPITSAGGNTYTVGIASTNPLRFFIAEPGGGYSVRPAKEVAESEIDGDFSIKRVVMTGKTYDGKDSLKMDPENMYYPLLGLFGRDVETTLAVGAYKHVFTHYKYMPSFVQEEQFGDGTYGRLSSGVCFAGISIHHSPILMADLTYYAHRQIPNRYDISGNDVDYDFTSTQGVLPSQMGGDGTKTTKLTATPTYVDVAEGNCGNGPLVWASMQYGSVGGAFANAFITLNGNPIAVKILPGFTIDITRDIERFQIGGSGYDAGQPVANVFKVAGRLTLLFEDNTIPANTLSNCTFGLNMKFVGSQIAATGQTYQYEVYIPRMKFLESDGPVRIDKALTVGGSFQAEKDSSVGTECRITLQNSFTHASLAGGFASLPLGLGGWSSV